MPGPQDDHFTPDALASFFAQGWQATPAQDRMGLRLEGEALAHTSADAADIVSDGVTPGVIQVPANGQPIVLLADGQTVGGYPKIATVITADLPRLAHLRPGTRVRFAPVTAEQAHEALTALRTRWQQWLAGREAFLPPGHIDEAALYGRNLISGMLATHPGEDTP
jgi:allophanate hydrolase